MSTSKKVLCVVLLLALVPLAAEATITRVIGLGGSGAGYIIRDASNPGIWPQLVATFPDICGAEFSTEMGNWDFQKAYINYKLNENPCVLHISLDKLPYRTFAMASDTLDAIPGGYNRLNIIWGRPVKDMLIGFQLTYTGKSLKHDEVAPYPKRDASYSSFGLNLGVTALERNLDASVGFEMPSFSDKIGDDPACENDGSMLMKFAARYWYKPSDTYAVIPNLKFTSIKDAAKQDEFSDSWTTTVFALGVGNNWKPVENMMAIFELGLQSINDKYESKAGDVSSDATDKEMDIYWRLGFESKVFEWLNGRFGAERSWASATVESEPTWGKPDISTSLTSTYLGATAHWNRLWLDFLVAPRLMKNGPYFVSGQSTDLFSRASLFYKFDK